ncbi:MAG: membrane fusion protein [Pseudohongiellaceae bacterium]
MREAPRVERSELFRPEVLIYRRDKSLSTAVISQSSAIKTMVWSSIGLMCLALLVLCLIRYKETNSARGILEPKSPSQKIRAPIEAIVTSVAITEGELVAKGQTVMTLSTLILNGNGESPQFSNIQRLKLAQESLAKELAMDERLYKSELARGSLSVAASEKSLSSLRLEATLLAQQEALSSSHLKSLASLLENSNISQSQFDRELLTHLSVERERNLVLSKINTAESEIADGLLQLDFFNLGFENKQLKAFSEKRRVASEIRNLDQETFISIQALQGGIVASLAVETGSSVSAGQALLTILPSHQDVKATLFVPSSIIGKIHTEQELLLGFDAFPVSEFGYTSATVVRISGATLDPRETLLPIPGLSEPVFKVIAELEKHYVEGAEVFPLVSGIQFSADFVMENLSLLEFIFRPVLQLKGKIL